MNIRQVKVLFGLFIGIKYTFTKSTFRKSGAKWQPSGRVYTDLNFLKVDTILLYFF